MAHVGESSSSASADKAPDCPPDLMSIEILNGGDGLDVLNYSANQWVNLPREQKWVDPDSSAQGRSANLDRLGRNLSFIVKFDKAGAYDFTVSLKPADGNTAYLPEEKARNANFKYEEAEKSYTTDGNGIKIVTHEFFVEPAGNNGFYLEAKYGDSTVTSVTVNNMRMLYYVELRMNGLTTISTDVPTVNNTLIECGIKMVPLPSVGMDYMDNIDYTTQSNEFLGKARMAYANSQGPSKEPHVVAIAYTDQLALKLPTLRIIQKGVAAGPGMPDVEIDIIDRQTGEIKELWNQIVSGEGWFIAAFFLKDGGTPGRDDIHMPESIFTLVPEDPQYPSMVKKVRANISGLPAAKGTITLWVDAVDWWAAGLSYPGNIIIVSTRCYWRQSPSSRQNQTLTHELGHQFRMASNGTSTNKAITFYEDHGHHGPHCCHGLSMVEMGATDYNGKNGDCVMFGQLNVGFTFCENCSPALMKQDLSTSLNSRF